jgi:hypothetical protein
LAGYQVRWQTDYEAVKAQRDALAKEYAELYPLLTARLCDLFHRVEALDQECSRINGEAPAGDHRRLLGVELTARKLAGFSTESPSIAKELKLPDFDHSDRMAWPSLQPSLAESYAMSMMAPHDPRYSADWAAELEKDQARRAATEARWAEDEAARQAKSRRDYEASLRR